MARCVGNRLLFHLTALTVLAGVSMVRAQTDSTDSQTDKSPAFSVRKEQPPVINAFEDFERYRDKKAWEKAFTALGKIEDGKPGRLVPDNDGFSIPTDLKIRAELLSLPPDGREAYRLFNNARAAKLLTDASRSQDLAALRKIVNRYFITSTGDLAADRLGDALFESGDFANAERCWRMVVENFPDSALSPALLQTKRAIAFSREGDWDQFEAVRAILHDRYAGQTARIGGADVVVTDLVDGLKIAAGTHRLSPGDSSTSSFVRSASADATLVLPANDQPAWQIPLMDAQAAAQLNAQLANNGWQFMATPLVSAVPATAVDDKRIYVNWLGICFAADLRTGKLLWRSDTFGDMAQKMSQAIMQGTSIDPQIYNITVAGDKLLCTRRSTDNQNYNELAMTRLNCLDCAGGKAIWKSDSGALSSWGFVGQPLMDGDHFYIVAHAQSSQDLSLLCINFEKGKLLWETALGSPVAGVNYRGMPTLPQPSILLRAGKVMLLTNNGALLQIDVGTHQLDWAFGYPANIPPKQQMSWGYAQPTPVIAPGAMICIGSTLYLKEYNSSLLLALDAAGPGIKWKRHIDAEAGIASLDGHNLLLAGPEVEAIDVESQVMQWDARTAQRTGSIQPLISGDWMYLFGSRGIESVRLSTGESGPVFRGYDRDSDGGMLWKTPTRLVSVSCRAITAYPLAAGSGSPH